MPYFVVVASDESGPFVAGHAAVGYDDGDTGAERTRHCRFDIFRLVGADYQQINPLEDETVYLRALQLVAPVGNARIERHLRMKQQFTLHLVIHLLAPRIIQTLAHTDAVLRLAMNTARP